MGAKQDARGFLCRAREGRDDVAGLAAEPLSGIVQPDLKAHLFQLAPRVCSDVPFLPGGTVYLEQVQKDCQEPLSVDQKTFPFLSGGRRISG